MSGGDPISNLNECKYLSLRYYLEAEAGKLVIVADECRMQESPVTDFSGSEIVDRVLGEAYPIESRPDYRSFKITFDGYVAVSVINESFAQPENNEDYSKKLRRYENSTFLDYLKQTTFASDVYPGPFTHHCVVMNDHVINVACQDSPEVTMTTVREQR